MFLSCSLGVSPSHAEVYLKKGKAEYLTFATSSFADNFFSESQNNVMTGKASQPESARLRGATKTLLQKLLQ
jgi:hypothetical protein